MSKKIQVAVIMPAYNEEACIAAVVNAVNNIREEDMELTPVVVNDCSKDSTKEIIGALNCVALNLPINLGIGGAVQTGIKYAYDNNFDYAVQIDGDGQHPPQFIPKLEREMQKLTWMWPSVQDLFITKGSNPLFCAGAAYNILPWLLRLITGVYITDPTSGMRMMNRKTMKLLYSYYPDEYPEPEALIIYHRKGLKFGEVPVQMSERMGGESSIKGFGAVYYMFKVTIAIIFTYLRK